MKTQSEHVQPIITRARQGLPVSNLNRRRMSPAKRSAILALVLALFWGGAALIVSLIA